MPAILQIARVIAQDPSNHTVHVMFPSTQISGIPVKVGLPGPADGVRIKKPPLPTRGTYGVVGFIGNDNRTAIWLCSVYAQQMDALTSDTDANMDYHSHMSGYYSSLDENGNMVHSFPDGTSLVIGSSASKAPTYRHIVDPQENRQTIPFPDEQRTPNKPAAFNVVLNHPSGAVVSIAPNGLVTITSPVRINIGGIGETLYRLIDERLIAVYNAHTHSDPQGGNTGPPNVALAVGAETTTITFAG